MRLTRLFVQLGVRKLRLTGGEPLLRANLADLIGDLTRIPGIEDVALTTNGVLLAKLCGRAQGRGPEAHHCQPRQLDPEVFAQMSGGFGGVDDVLDGIEHARRAGSTPIKVNAVIQRGVNDHTALDLSSASAAPASSCGSSSTWTSATATHWSQELVVPSKELAARIGERWPLRAAASATIAAKSPSATRSTTARARSASSPR